MIRRWMTSGIALIAVVAVLVACGGDDENRLDPPEIEYGVDMSEMGMPVTDARFTVATLPKESEDWLLFDDIGEFLKYVQAHDQEFDVMWVPDMNTEEWVHAEDALYLESEHLTFSPMGWGVAAFKDEASAQAAQEEHGGDIFTWETVQDQTWDQPPAPEGHH